MKSVRRRELFATIFARDGGRCTWCGIPVRPRAKGLHGAPDLATLDHLEPRARGGRTIPGNLTLACQACNNARGAMSAAGFRAFRAGMT